MSGLRQGTYSIVARDPETGDLGVAVQSHWFSVGSVVTWARPGAGAVATQANAEVSYGPLLLERLAAGEAPEAALADLLAADPLGASRQVAAVDARGRVAVHTGADCIPDAGHVSGEAVSCQANIMAVDGVWPAMLDAYQAAAGEALAERLMRALEAGEAAGGDLRGRQSAALLVVPAEGKPWATSTDLRVEDHPEPLQELRRLLQLQDAYRLAGEADTLLAGERYDEAARAYERASVLAPDSDELLFWAGLGAAQAGDLETALARVRRAIDIHAGWRELLDRLVGSVPSAVTVRDAMRSEL